MALSVLRTLCAECWDEYKQAAQAHPAAKREQRLGNSRDIKGMQQPKQLDRGFQLLVRVSCDVGPCFLCFSDDGDRSGS